ncbi:MAG: ornithine carbamoyltransferase [Pseudomonadota bacterium]
MIRHFINLPDVPLAELKSILQTAHAMKRAKMAPTQVLEGLTLAMVFDKWSTRTRLSFEVGMKQLGGHTIVMRKDEMLMGTVETIGDTAKVMSRMVDAVMIRNSNHDDVEEFASYAAVPVINAMTDRSHPCQIMADLMTIEEKKGTLDGAKVAWFGDYNNVAMTFIQAASLFGFELVLALPQVLHPKDKLPANVSLTTDATAAATHADVMVTDTWASMSQEAKDHSMMWPYQVNAALMAKAKKDAIFMHCLAAHRNEEVTDEVIDGPQSVVFDEAENRLHVQKAILAWSLENAGVSIQPRLPFSMEAKRSA